MELKIKVKQPNSWNTVNRANTQKVLDHCTFKCDGHYTDDYAHDAENNYGQNATSDGIKKDLTRKLINDAKNYKYVKLYWDAKDKEFVIYFGSWLSYSAKPNGDFKITEILVTEKLYDVPQEVKQLAETLEQHQKAYIKKNYSNIYQMDYVDKDTKKVSIKVRTKYYAVDIETSGKFLVDKQNLNVYSISAYGVPNYFIGKIEHVIMKLNFDIGNFQSEKTVYVVNF